jgi:hypothetical protein
VQVKKEHKEKLRKKTKETDENVAEQHSSMYSYVKYKNLGEPAEVPDNFTNKILKM